MIAKMKKLTFLVYHKEYDAFLKSIRDLGVVHVATKAQGSAEDAGLQESIRLSTRYAAAIKLLQGMNVQPVGNHAGNADRGMDVLTEMEDLQQQIQQVAHKLQSVEKEVAQLEPWGDFDPHSLERLHDAGYQIDFYICSDKQFKDEWADLYNATVINRVGSKLYFVTVIPNHVYADLEVESAKLPEISLSDLQVKREGLIKQNETLQKQMEDLAASAIPDLQAAQAKVHSQIEFSKVVLNTNSLADNKLMLLQGWIPVERIDEIKHFLETEEVYYEISDPSPEDDVPILLNNKGFFRLFEPIMRLYMLPKYNELDLTPFFAPFFMLFFGLCLGDSGYGLFMLLAVTVYRLVAKNIAASMKSILTLVQLLGASTMVCGMILKAVNQTIQFGFKYAVATIGWILVLVSSAIAFAAPGVMPMGGTVHLVFLVAGLLMAYLYNSPDKNIFVNIGLGLWDSYNMATGLLGDILSYVRLFALGLSGGILASVFNSLAVGMSPDNVIAGPIVMVLIFVIGHAINMFMNVLGAMVHPMRLTFVEFFKNSGYEGGGKEYKPFKN